MQRRKFIGTVAASIASVSIAGCSGIDGNGGNGSPTQGDDQQNAPEDTATSTQQNTGTPAENVERVIGNTPDGIEVQQTQLYIKGDTNARVTGTVKNTSDRQYEELEVQATLIDDQNDILGKWFDNTEERESGGLAAGETWNFTVEFESPDLDTVARYRVDVDGDIDNFVWGAENGTSNGSGNGTGTTTS